MPEKAKPATPGTRVGYRNPPEHTRFKKGQSGNPKGRPKGTLNLASVIGKTLRERVIINEYGRRKTVTKLQAAIKQLVNKAAAGDLSAVRQLAALATFAEERAAQTPPVDTSLGEDDQKIVQGILKRFGKSQEGGDEDDNKS